MSITATPLKALATGFLSMLLVVGGARAQEGEDPPHATDPQFSITPGYLDPSELPDSLALLGAPPGEGSAALARDEEARAVTLPLRGQARWDLASADADLEFPQPARNFACAMGVPIDEEHTPHVYRLMQRLTTDAGLSTYGIKNRYHRVRPFVAHHEGTCRAEQEDVLRQDGSYPSGHSATGWAWALALAEINPERADEILRRGLEFGQSRVVCDAHWQSDVDAGRIMGAATIARLQTNPDFRSDIVAAGDEVRKARKEGLAAPTDCRTEAEALAPK